MTTLSQVLNATNLDKIAPSMANLQKISVAGGYLNTVKLFYDTEQCRTLATVEYYTTAAGNLKRQESTIEVERFNSYNSKLHSYGDRTPLSYHRIESNKAMQAVITSALSELTADLKRATGASRWYYPA